MIIKLWRKEKKGREESEPMSVEMYHKERKKRKNLDLNPKLQIIPQRVFNVVIGIFLKFVKSMTKKHIKSFAENEKIPQLSWCWGI